MLVVRASKTSRLAIALATIALGGCAVLPGDDPTDSDAEGEEAVSQTEDALTVLRTCSWGSWNSFQSSCSCSYAESGLSGYATHYSNAAWGSVGTSYGWRSGQVQTRVQCTGNQTATSVWGKYPGARCPEGTDLKAVQCRVRFTK